MLNLAWYAVSVRSNFERIVAHSLRQKEYEILLPTYTFQRNWTERNKVIERALFPGYVFCRMDVQKRLPLLITPGVVSMVGIGKCPMPVEESEIAAIQRIVASGLPLAPVSFLKEGQFVYIKRGPLTGLEGVVVTIKNQCRLVLSVEMLQRSVTVEIDQDWAEPTQRAQVRVPKLNAA